MCCILYTNVITLFVNIKTSPPKCRPLESPLDHEDNLHDIHDVLLLEKSQEPLYEGLTTNILSTILLLVNLKVFNGLSNACFTQLLRYVMH